MLTVLEQAASVSELCKTPCEQWGEPNMRALLTLANHPLADAPDVDQLRRASQAFEHSLFGQCLSPLLFKRVDREF